jgi:SAM-dependent methyltransferase
MPTRMMLGSYSPIDGTIEFYHRVLNCLSEESLVIDLGAGRGAWWYDETVPAKRNARALRNHCKELIGVDVDPAVLTNPATHRNLLIKDGTLPIENNVADLVISDYVFEHIRDTSHFATEINRILKPGGIIAARTPHYMNYVAIGSRLARGPMYNWLLKRTQPNRRDEDCFPTYYRLNSLRQLKRIFRHYEDYSYLYVAEPAYTFGSKFVEPCLTLLHRFAPKAFVGNLFIFMRKPRHDER